MYSHTPLTSKCRFQRLQIIQSDSPAFRMSTFKKHDMSLSRSIGAFRVSTAIRIAASAATAVGPVFDLREFDFVSDELRRHTLPVNLIGQSACHSAVVPATARALLTSRIFLWRSHLGRRTDASVDVRLSALRSSSSALLRSALLGVAHTVWPFRIRSALQLAQSRFMTVVPFAPSFSRHRFFWDPAIRAVHALRP